MVIGDITPLVVDDEPTFLQKPFLPAELLERVGKVLGPDFDVDPWSTRNEILLGCGHYTKVAVLGFKHLDVKLISGSTVTFAGAMPKKNGRNYYYALQDVNGDKHLEMVFKFKGEDLKLKSTDTVAEPKGKLQDGAPFAGTDKVKVLK